MVNLTNIYIVDDHRLFSEGLKRSIESNGDFEVKKVFETADELLAALHFEQPDIVIADITMPGLSGIELSKRIREKYPQQKILILSMHEGVGWVRPAMEAGINGYLLKDCHVDELVLALHTIQQGATYFSPRISAIREYPKAELELTPREADVLKQLATGKNTREIGEILFISENTVETHRRNLLLKSGCKNAAELIRWGLHQGYIQL